MSDKNKWNLIRHSRQIADTGEYAVYYEITNGDISIMTKHDDDEKLQPIVDALNESGCEFYQDDYHKYENEVLKEEIAKLHEMRNEMRKSGYF